MTKFKRFFIVGAMVLAIGATSVTAFAASQYATPAEAAAGLTGKTVESVIKERTQDGKTYGAIADEAGKLDEFKGEVLEIKKSILDQRVADGKMTQAQAEAWLKSYEERLATCDGKAAGGLGSGMGFGGGMGGGRGMGCGYAAPTK